MDIRFVNGRGEIINASELSIKVMGNSIIGINAEQKIMEIERYGSEKEARDELRGVVECLMEASREESQVVMIDLRRSKG